MSEHPIKAPIPNHPVTSFKGQLSLNVFHLCVYFRPCGVFLWRTTPSCNRRRRRGNKKKLSILLGSNDRCGMLAHNFIQRLIQMVFSNIKCDEQVLYIKAYHLNQRYQRFSALCEIDSTFPDNSHSWAKMYRWFKKLEDRVSDAPKRSRQRRMGLDFVYALVEMVGQSPYCTSHYLA